MSYLTARIWLENLLLACPRGEAKDDCPLTELRKMSFKERNLQVDEMTDNEIEGILDHHKKCIFSNGDCNLNC